MTTNTFWWNYFDLSQGSYSFTRHCFGATDANVYSKKDKQHFSIMKIVLATHDN